MDSKSKVNMAKLANMAVVTETGYVYASWPAVKTSVESQPQKFIII